MTVPSRNRRTSLRAQAARIAAVLTLAVVAAACEMSPTSPVAEEGGEQLAPGEMSASDACLFSCIDHTASGLVWDIGYAWGAVWRGEGGDAAGPFYRAMTLEMDGQRPRRAGGWFGPSYPQVIDHHDETGELLGTEYVMTGFAQVPYPFRLERRVYLSANGGFVRWIDVVSNYLAYGSPQTASVQLLSGIGQSGEELEIDRTPNGDAVLDAGEPWVVAHAAHRRQVAHVYGSVGIGPTLSVNRTDNFDADFRSGEYLVADHAFLVPAGESRIVMTLVTQSPDVATPEALAALEPSDVLVGVSDTDKTLIVNWDFEPADTIPPTIEFSGNAGTYDVSEQVLITCTADDGDGSGVATASCPTVVESPAYDLGTGTHEYTATATDEAGNTASENTSFEVIVTTDGIGDLIDQWVASGGVAGALRAKLRDLNAGGGGGGGAQALAAGPGARGAAAKRSNARSQAGKLGAFINHVNALRGKLLTDEQADLLIEFAQQL